MITEYKNILFSSNNNQTGQNSNVTNEVSANFVFYNHSCKQDYPSYHGYGVYAWTDLTTTGYKFPGSQHVNRKTAKAGFWLTISHLVKNDLNGHFLTDQPGQPFNGDPGNKAGFDLPPP